MLVFRVQQVEGGTISTEEKSHSFPLEKEKGPQQRFAPYSAAPPVASSPMTHSWTDVLLTRFSVLCSPNTPLLTAAQEFNVNLMVPQAHQACLKVLLQTSGAELCCQDAGDVFFS